MKKLSDFNEEVWNEYETTKKPVEKVLRRQGYVIHQKQNHGGCGETEVSLDGLLLRINWQACGAHISVDTITDKVLDFLKQEITDVENIDLLNCDYFWINGWELVDFLLSNYFDKFESLAERLDDYNSPKHCQMDCYDCQNFYAGLCDECNGTNMFYEGK